MTSAKITITEPVDAVSGGEPEPEPAAGRWSRCVLWQPGSWCFQGGLVPPGSMPMPQLLSVGISELMPDPTQPRKTFLGEEIERLAASIAARGVLTPLRVLRDEERQCWIIVCGESRWRAARIAGLTHLPCILVEGHPDETDLLADRIVENECRHDLAPLDLARAIAKLKALKAATSQQISKELGLSAAAITRAESLLTLPEDIQSLVDAGSVSESAAYEISRLPEEKSQRELAHAVAAGRLNRSQVTEAVHRAIGKKKIQPKASRLSCRLDGGVSVTVSAGEPLTWDVVLEAIDRIRKEARKLCDTGKDVSALAQVLRAS
jgi:ParB family chromosome partitioning protein